MFSYLAIGVMYFSVCSSRSIDSVLLNASLSIEGAFRPWRRVAIHVSHIRSICIVNCLPHEWRWGHDFHLLHLWFCHLDTLLSIHLLECLVVYRFHSIYCSMQLIIPLIEIPYYIYSEQPQLILPCSLFLPRFVFSFISYSLSAGLTLYV